MKIESYEQGTPSWVDLGTTDVEGSKSFYADLFGWTYEENDLGGMGMMVLSMGMKDGAYTAGIYAQRPDEAEMGIPPHWMTYITVDDVDATAERVTKIGGSVMGEPFDAFNLFRMAVVSDPTGGMVFICQPKDHIGAGVKAEHGALAWSELLTTDPDAAVGFFSDLLGLSVETGPTPESGEYNVLKVSDQEVFGIMAMPEHLVQQEVPPHWEPYFQVDDIGDAVSKVEAVGGTVLMTPTSMEGVGTFAVAQDPQGAVFGLITP